jgi:NADH dehydrogenase [ubiquinone] 1 alpha subcomplex assembly factor 7
VWEQMGAPENVRIIELGPGRATMLIDALRATKIVKGFHDAVVLHLVEISPALQKVQEQRLEQLGVPVLWHQSLDEIPGGPGIIVANEFVDALPVHQALKQANGWHERGVGIGPQDNLVFALAPGALPHFAAALPRPLRDCPDGSIFEWRADNLALEIGRRVRRNGGAALIIDYGHAKFGLGDTLQAVAGHAYTDPLRAPGEADLTAHVDFEALAQSAESIGGRIHGPVPQRDFLLGLGLVPRADALKANAAPDKAQQVDQARARLTAAGATGMGELFKVLAIADPALGPLPGFETAKR